MAKIKPAKELRFTSHEINLVWDGLQEVENSLYRWSWERPQDYTASEVRQYKRLLERVERLVKKVRPYASGKTLYGRG